MCAAQARGAGHPAPRCELARNGPAVGRARRRAGRRRHVEAFVQAADVADRERLVAGIGSQELQDALKRQRTREMQAQHLAAPVAAEIERHHLGPYHRVDRAPGLWLEARDPELWRQYRVGGEEGVDARGVRFEQVFRFGVVALEIRGGDAPQPERAHQAVDRQRPGAGDLGNVARSDPAAGLHLPQSVLRMREAEGERSIGDRAGEDVRDAVRVAQDLDRRFHARETNLALDLRQRSPQVQERTNRQSEADSDN